MRFAVLVLALGVSASARHHRPLGPLVGGASCNTISYHGGPLIHSVKVVLLMWGGAATHKDELARYYSAIVDSPYLDWLDEYDQGSYSIGRGSFVAALVDPSPPPATQLNDINDIQPELERLEAAGVIPAPDPNTLYMIHFPPGVVIDDGTGSTSCDGGSSWSYCAYHYNFIGSAGDYRYAVIPDLSASGCAQACGIGGSSDVFLAESFSGSHELMEAITDPDYPNGWEDDACGELADICDDDPTPGSAAGYPVEKIWSVRQNACVDRPGPPIDDGGTAVTIDLGAPDLAEPAPSNDPENHPPPDLLPSSSQRDLADALSPAKPDGAAGGCGCSLGGGGATGVGWLWLLFLVQAWRRGKSMAPASRLARFCARAVRIASISQG